MNNQLAQISWPLPRLGEALDVLARRSQLAIDSAGVSTPPEGLEQSGEAQGRWIEAVARGMSLEAKEVFFSYSEIEQTISTSGPALLRLRINGGTRFLLLLRRKGRKVCILDSDLREHQVRPSLICANLSAELEAPLAPELDRLLDRIGVPKRRRTKARAAILRERLSPFTLGGIWLLHLSPGVSFVRQLQHARVPRDVGGLAAAHAFQYVLWLLAWWVVGRGALQGRLDYAWLAAWALLLLTLVPLRLFITRRQGVLAIRAGGLLKQRLLYGALRLGPEQTRHQGIGQLLGRIIETEVVESLALSGGFLSLLAVVELCIVAPVLVLGSGGWAHAAVLFVWVTGTLFLSMRYFKRRQRWAQMRLGITNDLVERMVGHRTRLAQEPRERWHEAEDQALEHYHLASEKMDRLSVWFASVVPRGWLFIGVFGLAPAFVYANTSAGSLAVGLGGVLLAYAALRRLTNGVIYLTDALIAWKQVAPLFQAAAPAEPSSTDIFSPDAQPLKAGEALLDARELVFRYRDRTEPVIKGSSLRILAGDKILLEGPSGSGKSTLASLLVGLRQPESGLLLLRGLDRQTLGDENWRRMVVAAPQFHENHVMAETFAFNLLMGRRWPARHEDLEEAEAVCRELGLGELIDRMPAGMLQMVGETGWQLSHGERSRLYIARALLQHTELVVLDESFAALDPENLRRALGSVLERASTLVVVAHP